MRAETDLERESLGHSGCLIECWYFSEYQVLERLTREGSSIFLRKIHN